LDAWARREFARRSALVSPKASLSQVLSHTLPLLVCVLEAALVVGEFWEGGPARMGPCLGQLWGRVGRCVSNEGALQHRRRAQGSATDCIRVFVQHGAGHER